MTCITGNDVEKYMEYLSDKHKEYEFNIPTEKAWRIYKEDPNMSSDCEKFREIVKISEDEEKLRKTTFTNNKEGFIEDVDKTDKKTVFRLILTDK